MLKVARDHLAWGPNMAMGTPVWKEVKHLLASCLEISPCRYDRLQSDPLCRCCFGCS